MIDANGTRHHLVLGKADWRRSRSEGARKWEYDERPGEEVLRLQGEIFTFAGKTVLSQADRRGAAQDRYGHWYWIDGHATAIIARLASASEPEQLWPNASGASCLHVAEGAFSPAEETVSGPEKLAGLAVTTEGYLVVGSPDAGSLLVFDLYALDGGILRIPLPERGGPGSGLTVPHDLAALPDGGLLVLDRINKRVWVLDNSFRPAPSDPEEKPDALVFQPKDGTTRRVQAEKRAEPVNLGPDSSPVAVEPLPDGTFWVLDTPDDENKPSALRRFAKDGTRLVDEILCTNNLIEQPADSLELKNVRGHDVAFLPTSCPSGGVNVSCGLLYIADLSGDQAYVLYYEPGPQTNRDLECEYTPILLIERRYYPLRNFTGAALVSDWQTGEVHYLQGKCTQENGAPCAGTQKGDKIHWQGKRWLPVKSLPRMKFEETAALILPANPTAYLCEPTGDKCDPVRIQETAGASDIGFDGRDPGCVWHRLCIDACIPPETSVRVEARAADVEDDLALEPWIEQPPPYKRPTGSEIPYYALWSDKELQNRDTGTWELLFQQVQGRYMQLRLTLTGNRRSSPSLRALRAHYPRFSYLNAYLPAVYRQDAASMYFVENFLANPEGIFTTVEGQIAQVQTLMDVRSVPVEAVDWLAKWLGLAFEPSWTDYQRRLLIAHAPYFFLRRGTLPGLLQAILLAVHPEIGPDIFRDDVACAEIRIVERFLTRTQPGIVFGDPTEWELETGDALTIAEERAHDFVVLLPTALNAETRRLVERVVELEKPAHTTFTIKEYWAYFRVGEVRLGIDTVLGQGGRFEIFRLGQTALAEGTLGAAFPNDLTVRTVL